MTREEQLKDFFSTALSGESKSYDDYNWYSSTGLHSYISGSGRPKYPLLSKPLSQLTVGEVKALQNKPRDSKGQLWATGRYQIIPSTLVAMQKAAGVRDSDVYGQAVQDKLGWQLLMTRKPVRDYLSGKVPDNEDSLQKAALEISKIWSSVGVPYGVNGASKNQSYYTKGGEKAKVSSETIMAKLRQLRTGVSAAVKAVKGAVKEAVEYHPLITIGVSAAVVLVAYAIYTNVKKR